MLRSEGFAGTSGRLASWLGFLIAESKCSYEEAFPCIQSLACTGLRIEEDFLGCEQNPILSKRVFSFECVTSREIISTSNLIKSRAVEQRILQRSSTGFFQCVIVIFPLWD